MKNLIFVIIVMVIFVACNKRTGGRDFFSDVQIHYIDKAGKDLFTDGQNGYFKDNIRIYDFQNGTKTLLHSPSNIAPYGYYFSEYFPSTIVTGSSNNNIVNGYTVNIIHLKEGIEDTLKIHLTGNKQMGSEYDGIWYNGVQYPAIIGVDTITIIK